MGLTTRTLSFLAAAYVVPVTTVSGIMGTFAMVTDTPFVDNYISADPETNLVTEMVDSGHAGVPFVYVASSLTRTWDFTAGQVCTNDNAASLIGFVPSFSSVMDCMLIKDFADQEHVTKIKATLSQ